MNKLVKVGHISRETKSQFRAIVWDGAGTQPHPLTSCTINGVTTFALTNGQVPVRRGANGNCVF